MPAQRTKTMGFEDVPASRDQILCRICSDTEFAVRDVIIKRTSKASYIKSAAHQGAFRASESRNTTATGPAHLDVPTRFQAARLTFVDMLGNTSKNTPEEPSNRPPSPRENPFSEVLQYNSDFFDANGDQILFSAGHAKDTRRTEQIEIQEQIRRLALLPRHSIFGQFSEVLEDAAPEGNTVDAAFSAALQRMGIADESDEEGDEEFEYAKVNEEEEWFPHGSRTMFMLDLLDNLPRLRLSDDHLKAILWVMRECKTPNVPSFSALRKKQASMTQEVGIKPQHHTSSLGNHFYMNHPAKLLGLDWANPLVRPFIHIYPEVSGPISESWQAGKWTEEIDFDDLSPMWADWKSTNSHRHFYIKELARQRDGTFVVPIRWVTVDDIVHVDVQDVLEVHTAEGSLFNIRATSVRRIAASALKYNYLDLCASLSQIKFTEYSPSYSMPHPLREKAQGRPMFRLRVMPWSDDVSGNVSKQYNAHTNMYVTNLNLPHQKLSQEYFVRFASTSPHASSSELFVALGDDFVPDVWHEAYDCELEQDILFELIPHVLPADNPQQSETASHIGMGGSLGCRRGLTGGSKEQRETDNGYHALYMPDSEARTTEMTIQTIRLQVWLACLGNQASLDELYTSTGVKDKIAQHWIKLVLTKAKEAQHIQLTNVDTRNPKLNDSRCKGPERASLKSDIKHCIQRELWDWVVQQPENDPPQLGAPLDLRPGVHYNILLNTRGIDPHRDTPAEILHTYLLGNDKYIWHDTTKSWDDKKEDIFASRLQSASIDALSIPAPRPRYVVQYKNSLIGKHFKMLQQLGVFQLHGLCPPLVFDLWKATGELGALLWFPKIRNMDLYLADLDILVNNLLDIWGLIDPNRILVKGKLHVLPHIISDSKRFGPAILYATEIFECFNGVFRLCSIFSNHLAPSHDIATTLADMERFKHMVSGGWWKNSTGKFIQAGGHVRSFLASNRELQRRLGWSENSQLKPGTAKLQTAKNREPVLGAGIFEKYSLLEPTPVGSTWVRCKYIVAQSGDSCKDGSWIFFRNGNGSPLAGRIIKTLARDGLALIGKNIVVFVELFTVLDVRDMRLNMPILIPSAGGEISLAYPTDIMFAFNVQHDCFTSQCKTQAMPVLQERIVTDRTELRMVHSTAQQFILNLHALHNAHLIREVLPRSLTAPIPYLEDRVASHARFAAQLRETGPAKRAATKAKANATRQRNKEGKAATATAQARRQQDEREADGMDDREIMDLDGD